MVDRLRRTPSVGEKTADVPSLESVSKDMHSEKGYDLSNYCMRKLLSPLVKVGKEGSHQYLSI
jgi:hypothetical protein